MLARQTKMHRTHRQTPRRATNVRGTESAELARQSPELYAKLNSQDARSLYTRNTQDIAWGDLCSAVKCKAIATEFSPVFLDEEADVNGLPRAVYLIPVCYSHRVGVSSVVFVGAAVRLCSLSPDECRQLKVAAEDPLRCPPSPKSIHVRCIAVTRIGTRCDHLTKQSKYGELCKYHSRQRKSGSSQFKTIFAYADEAHTASEKTRALQLEADALVERKQDELRSAVRTRDAAALVHFEASERSRLLLSFIVENAQANFITLERANKTIFK
jgi:hypothetical protein